MFHKPFFLICHNPLSDNYYKTKANMLLDYSNDIQLELDAKNITNIMTQNIAFEDIR